MMRGQHVIDGARSALGAFTFAGLEARTGAELPGRFHDATPAEVATAAAAAQRAARLTGELKRTTDQLRRFADEGDRGGWLGMRVDASRGADLRRVALPIGPAAVFGASNFPLAFSVAGGDTAAAWAAACPVIVKAHPAHRGTSELPADAIVDVLARSPAGDAAAPRPARYGIRQRTL